MLTFRASRRRIVVAATFTAQPLEKPLSFWLSELGLRAPIVFAPYGQLFQALLDPASSLRTNDDGLNVILVRPDDLCGGATADLTSTEAARQALDRNARELVAALGEAVAATYVPFVVAWCPGSPALAGSGPLAATLHEIEATVGRAIGELERTELVTAIELCEAFRDRSCHDIGGDRLAHIPYTPAFFAAVAAAIARRWRALAVPARKVIAVDCDNTLWTGIVGEDGSAGIEIDAGRQALQRYLVERQKSGALICLCSKNNPDDVFEVFRSRPEMILGPQHLVGWRIGWNAKSQSLRELAEELGLGLDSFALVDDSPIECAEVGVNCPGVLTLELPAESARIPGWLSRLWAFDQRVVTEEDRERTAMVRQDRERERLRLGSTSIADFIRGLGVELDVAGMTAADVPRVAQLTQRTNQFNSTTLRLGESQVRVLAARVDIEVLVARIRDRFGDYGLTGVLVCSRRPPVLRVEAFLLSCRVLGRGVESRLMAELAALAERHALAAVEIPFVSTAKNRPAGEFLDRIGTGRRSPDREGEKVYTFTLDEARAAGNSWVMATPSAAPPPEPLAPALVHTLDESAVARRIILDLGDPHRVAEILDAARRRPRPVMRQPFVAPRAPLQSVLASLVGECLDVAPVGIDDDFFELGVDSMSAARLLSRIEATSGVAFELSAVFDTTTVAKLAEAVERAQLAAIGEVALQTAIAELDGLSDDDVSALLEAENGRVGG